MPFVMMRWIFMRVLTAHISLSQSFELFVHGTSIYMHISLIYFYCCVSIYNNFFNKICLHQKRFGTLNVQHLCIFNLVGKYFWNKGATHNT